MSPKDNEGLHREKIRAVRDALAAGLVGHELLIERDEFRNAFWQRFDAFFGVT